ncbi:MAG: hypothetical protein KDA75_06200 [Planctomycetaceae bacterium]|nr:hypothetical protein [Planctomycetaceae bacterium]
MPVCKVKVAGLTLLRQRRGTASVIMFLTLRTEAGQANSIVHPSTWERSHRADRKAAVLELQEMQPREHGVNHVVVDKPDKLSDRLAALRPQPREFR